MLSLRASRSSSCISMVSFLIARVAPTIAVDAAHQHSTIVVDLHEREPQVGQTLLLIRSLGPNDPSPTLALAASAWPPAALARQTVSLSKCRALQAALAASGPSQDCPCQWVVGLSFVGRAPTARPKADKVRALCDAGVRPAEIARQVGISRTSVYRVLKA